MIISGHLALLDVLPADLSRQLAARWLRSDRGAAELYRNDSAFIPGFGDQSAKPHNLPALSDLTDDGEVYASMCKAAHLKSPDDCRWWESDWSQELEPRTSLLQAADAAECILRMPGVRRYAFVTEQHLFMLSKIAWTSNVPTCGRRSQHYTPQPLGHVSELLQGLTQLQEDVENTAEKLACDLKRRRGYLLSEFMTLPDKVDMNAAETADVIEYQHRLVRNSHLTSK